MMGNVFALGLVNQKRLVILLTGLLVLVISFLTLIPIEVPQGVPGTDKMHHVTAFAALVIPAAFLWPRVLLCVAPIAILYGGAIELLQPYVGRSKSLGDFQADILGVFLGVLAGLFLRWCARVVRAQ